MSQKDFQTPELQDTDGEKRKRTLTEKGTELYYSQRKKHIDYLNVLWDRLDSAIQDIEFTEKQTAPLHLLEGTITQAYENYRRQTGIYTEFLEPNRKEESSRDLEEHQTLYHQQSQKVQNSLKTIQDIRSKVAVTEIAKSTKSKASGGRYTNKGTVSETSSKARQKRAEAEAAKTELAFAERRTLLLKQEAELEELSARNKARIEEEAAQAARKKAELQADLRLLAARQAAAVAEAEASALEKEETGSQDLDEHDFLPEQRMDLQSRVEEYIRQHAPMTSQQEVIPKSDTSPLNAPTVPEYMQTNISSTPAFPLPMGTTNLAYVHHAAPVQMTSLPTRQSIVPPNFAANVMSNYNPVTNIPPAYLGLPPVKSFYQQAGYNNRTGDPIMSTLNRDAPVFVPSVGQSIPTIIPTSSTTGINLNPLNMNPTSEITKFLIRKDLLFSRLTNFNDRPESYYVWKASFKCVINELQVSDSEQLDLLVKWLGVESSKHAISIRASNADNPTRGLQRLWQRLDERYGSPEMVEASLKSKLSNFPKLTVKDNKRLYELSDILSEIEYVKENPKFRNLLGYFDSSSGIKPIVSKLPYGLQEKWTTRAVKYISAHDVPFPPFTVFSTFIREMSRIKNNPGFSYDLETAKAVGGFAGKQNGKGKDKISVRKLSVEQQSAGSDVHTSLDRCILHKTKHTLDECRGFRSKSIEERKKLLKQNNICFKCCASNTHKSRDCRTAVCCKECGSKYHTTALHISRPKHPATDLSSSSPAQQEGVEEWSSDKPSAVPSADSRCTEICIDSYSGKSCAKILPVNVYHKDNPEKSIRMYAIIDDQSNRSLASSEFFNVFGVQENPENYTLSTCSGKVVASGRRAKGFVIESVQGDVQFDLPVLIECDGIPNNREEIPTPEITLHYPHLAEINENIAPIDDNCHILLLVGRDLIEAHHVLRQIYGPPKAPYAQQLKLGWVIIGETCLDKQHAPAYVNVNKMYLLPSGQATIMRPCENKFDVREPYSDTMENSSLFVKTKDDDKPGLSYEDRMFMKQMDNEFVRDSSGSWVAPLPFRMPRQPLPNNREQAVQRAKLLDANLKKNPVKKEHFLTFMGKILDNNHAEVAPPLNDDEECWYLPLFGVYHPRKPDQIRGVFDSSAQFNGVSFNKVLLSGPDLSNSLIGILLRFRREMVAVTTDVEHMFHCFVVREDHRNYLRFLWHKENDFDKEIIEYRMRKHVFGNSPSPAVATLGLRKTAQAAESEYGSHVTEFVTRDFYVDDGLISCPTAKEAIRIVKGTQNALKKYGNLRLHKIASNSPDVISAFPTEDLATNLKDLDLDADNKPLQRSLGLSWDVNIDSFLFQLLSEDKPVTRRGILSTINSIYDPLGFLAPMTIYGKLLLRKVVSETVDWDQPLPIEVASNWITWRDTLKVLDTLRIPRTYVTHLSATTNKELHIFSDASEKAIAAVAYLRTTDMDGTPKLEFVLGKAKVAPTSGHTIPRLELCSAVLAVEIAQCIVNHLDLPLDAVKYYTDSKMWSWATFVMSQGDSMSTELIGLSA